MLDQDPDPGSAGRRARHGGVVDQNPDPGSACTRRARHGEVVERDGVVVMAAQLSQSRHNRTGVGSGIPALSATNNTAECGGPLVRHPLPALLAKQC